MRTQSPVEIFGMGGGTLKDTDVVKAVKCLYGQLSKCKGFIDRDWPDGTTPFEVFTWLCKQADEISKAHKSACTLQQNKQGTQYRIIEGYHMEDLDYGAKLPVSWLPSILYRWPDLHDFAVQVFASLLRDRGLPFYNSFMPGSFLHERMREEMHESGDEFQALQSAISFYSDSYPKIYHDRFKHASAPPDRLKKIPTEDGAIEIYDWLLQAIPLCRDIEYFWNYIGDPDLITGYTTGDWLQGGRMITPGEGWGLVWSVNEKDCAWYIYWQELEAMAEHHGYCGAGIVTEMGQQPPLMKNTWMHQLGDWLSDGIRLIAKLETKGLIHDIYHEHQASLDLPHAK